MPKSNYPEILTAITFNLVKLGKIIYMFGVDPEPTFEVLLDYLRQSHGFDFTGYKRSSWMRLVHYRMHMLPIQSYGDYIDYLNEHPEEFLCLFNTILINLTSFFRDVSAWDYLAARIIPSIVANKPSDEPIRVWSAGCASGEETYTLAILLAEALGIEQFKARVQIYGTDVDAEALTQCRQGSYLSSKVMDIPSDLLEKYFEPADDRYIFRQDLRHCIKFSYHNLIDHVPMSKIDLLVCRNVLIYLTLETQIKALVRFHLSIANGGFLFLGNVERVPIRITNLFTPINLHHHIFTKLPGYSNELALSHLYQVIGSLSKSSIHPSPTTVVTLLSSGKPTELLVE